MFINATTNGGNGHRTSYPTRLNKRRGFSLVELAMVLAIIALLVAGIMLFFAKVQDQQKANDLVTESTIILSAMPQLWTNGQGYSGNLNTLLQGTAQIPKKWATSGDGPGFIGTPYKTSIFMAGATEVGSSLIQDYTIEYYSPTVRACVMLMTSDFGSRVLERETWNGDQSEVGSDGAKMSVTAAEAACVGSPGHFAFLLFKG
jgi:prepilin-type N-terminal cleavage/methylation domain-containing protein